MKSLSLFNALAVDEAPLSLKIEGSDLEVRMGFRHSGICNNNDLLAHQKDFISSDAIGNGAIFTCAGLSFALIWRNLFIINYFEKNSANAISSQYDVQFMKIVASETSAKVIIKKQVFRSEDNFY